MTISLDGHITSTRKCLCYFISCHRQDTHSLHVKHTCSCLLIPSYWFMCMCRATQQRQWKPPSGFKISRGESYSKNRRIYHSTSEKVSPVSPTLRMEYAKDDLFFRPISPAKPSFALSLKEIQIAKIRENINELRVRPPATGKVTVQRIEHVGLKDFSGYVWKRSKYLRR